MVLASSHHKLKPNPRCEPVEVAKFSPIVAAWLRLSAVGPPRIDASADIGAHAAWNGCIPRLNTWPAMPGSCDAAWPAMLYAFEKKSVAPLEIARAASPAA